MLNIIVNELKDYVEVDESEITEKTDPVNDLHLNSYDFICLIGKLENELNITIPERELRKFENLGDLDTYIRENAMK